MKVSELFEATAEIQPITATPKGENAFVVNTKATSGPTLDAIYYVFKTFNKKRGTTVKMKSGLPADLSRMLKNRPNGIVITFEDPEGAKEKVEAAIEDAKATAQKDMEKKAAHKATEPDRKKAASKFNAEKRKADLEKYAKLYGKGTWGRVTYRQEGGDDGYQYVVRVDGRKHGSGLTLRSAEHDKRMLVNDIAKREKLGKYAE